MNKKLILLLLATLTTLFLACSKDDENIFSKTDPNDPDIERTIKLVVKVRERYYGQDDWRTVRCKLDCEEDDLHYHPEYPAESIPFPKDLSIDWGDGQTTFSDRHEYAYSGTYTITIKGKNIKWLDLYAECISIDLKECNSLHGLDLWLEDDALDLSGYKALKFLYIASDNLKSLTLNDCPSLIYCTVEESPNLTSAKFNNCKALTYLKLDESESLASLELGNCESLQTLIIYDNDNKLNSLDVSCCRRLTKLNCNSCNLTSLDVSNSPSLEDLQCSGNQISTLKVNSKTIRYLSCYSNNLSTNAINEIFKTLPINHSSDQHYVSIGDNPGSEYCNKSIAENKGWTVNNW